MRVLASCVVLAAACAAEQPPPSAPVVPASSFTPMPTAPAPSDPTLTCGPQPPLPTVKTAPTCTEVVLQNRHDREQLTVQLSSGALTRIDCPRMRFHNQDTPSCIVRDVAGTLRGACCPPGHTDPSDPDCVNEGSIDEMYRRHQVWEWCQKDVPRTKPCEPCVWPTGAER